MKSKGSVMVSIAILFFVSLLIVSRQLLSKAYFSCHGEDTFAYVSWAWQFVEALKEGIIYPRWMPINYWDYGSPTFILLPPFAFYLVAFFNIFTGSIITAMNITKFLALFLSGAGMFFLVREFYSEKIALLTSSFYIVFPYNIFQFYFIGTFASTVSFMWFAPIILFTYRSMRDGQHKDILYAGLCYAGLILTHLINAYMFTFVLMAFVLYLSIVNRNLKNILVIPVVILIGFLISAAYILPVIFEKQFVNLREFIGEGTERGFIFNYRNLFILPDMTDKFSTGHLWNAYYDMFVFYVFLFSIIIILSSFQIMKMRKIDTMKNANSVNIFFLGAAVCTIFFMFGLSTLIWESIPFFKYIQFPHRWLNITTFAAVFLCAGILWVTHNILKTKRERWILTVILCCICLISFFLDYKYIRFTHFIHEKELLPVRAPNWYKEHLPVWVDIEKIDKSEDIKQIVAIQEGVGEAEVVTWMSAERVIEIKAQEPVRLRIQTFYFPGWKAYVDDMHTAVQTEKGSGAMLIDIPQGNHKLILRFEDTPVRYYSKLVSMVSFFSMVVLILFSKRKQYG